MASEREFSFTEEGLRRAAGEVTDALLADLPAPGDCAHNFSQDFEKAMAPLFRQQRLRQKRRERLRRAARLRRLPCRLRKRQRQVRFQRAAKPWKPARRLQGAAPER